MLCLGERHGSPNGDRWNRAETYQRDSSQFFLKAEFLCYAPGKELVMASIAFTSVGKLIELLSAATAGEDAYFRVLSSNRLAVGTDPFHPTHILDISREVLVPFKQAEPTWDASMRQQGSPAANGYAKISPD
jgi:hypothetical protein